VEFDTRLLDRIGQPLSSSLRFQKGVAMKAAESQFVSMARLIDGRPTHLSHAPVHFRSLLRRKIRAGLGRFYRVTGAESAVVWPGLSPRSPGMRPRAHRVAWPGLSPRSPGMRPRAHRVAWPGLSPRSPGMRPRAHRVAWPGLSPQSPGKP